jgi:ABC-2 type transport system permease protein
MNTPLNPTLETPFGSPIAPAPHISEWQRLYWSARRELWENRSVYLAPIAVAIVYLFGFMISLVRFPAKVRAATDLDPMQQHRLYQHSYHFVALLVMGVAFVVGIFYCLDALHGERRDRSILFWKSLPVSDLTTVLSKASIPLLALPVICFAITFVTQWIMLLLSSAALLAGGLSAAPLWKHVPFVDMAGMLLYHLIAVHALWYAPIYAWLLLVSAWARRATFLWAFLPPFAIWLIERIAFHTSHFGSLLAYRIGGDPADVTVPGTTPLDSMTHLTPMHFFATPGLWIGLALAAAFLALAVRIRRYQGPI